MRGETEETGAPRTRRSLPPAPSRVAGASPPSGKAPRGTFGTGGRTEAGLGVGVVPSDAEVPWGWDTERGGGSVGAAVTSEARPRHSHGSASAPASEGPAHPAGTRVVRSRRFHSNCSRAGSEFSGRGLGSFWGLLPPGAEAREKQRGWGLKGGLVASYTWTPTLPGTVLGRSWGNRSW